MEKEFSIGIDIGGTNTVYGIVDRRGQIITQDSIKTKHYPILENYIDALSKSVTSLITKAEVMNNIVGVGVGAPNGNYITGSIEYAPNLQYWGDVVPIAKMLSEHLALPVTLTNDANAAAIGEKNYGIAIGMSNFIVITLGTGLGSGIVANEELLYGQHGFAGELGHFTAVRDGRPCNCGKKGCLERYASATGLILTAKEFSQNCKEESLLHKIDIDKITSEDICKLALEGDWLAQEVFEYTGDILGKAFADFVVFSNPEAIILFGGLAKAGDLLLNPIRKSMEENLLPLFKGKIKLLISQLKESDAAILGASSLGWLVRT